MSCNRRIIIKDSPSDLALTAAEIFVTTARRSVAEKDLFAVALSGGSTPRPMHRLLAEEPHRSEVPWSKTHLFWVDERCVSEHDPASNYGTARKDFLDRLSIPREHTHPMPPEEPPEKGAMIYERELQAFFRLDQGQVPRFDLIFLGLGNDGHTASLFPGKRVLDERAKWIVHVSGGHPHVSRLTMTLPLLNHAVDVVFLVSGREKASTVKTILEEEGADLPAKRIQPVKGRLTWLLDHEAAGLLTGV